MSLKQDQSQGSADTGLNDSGTEDEQKSEKESGNGKKVKKTSQPKKAVKSPKIR